MALYKVASHVCMRNLFPRQILKELPKGILANIIET